MSCKYKTLSFKHTSVDNLKVVIFVFHSYICLKITWWLYAVVFLFIYTAVKPLYSQLIFIDAVKSYFAIFSDGLSPAYL